MRFNGCPSFFVFLLHSHVLSAFLTTSIHIKMPQQLSYTTLLLRHPKYIFLIAAVLYLALVWTSFFLGPVYLFLLCCAAAFYYAFLFPNGKEWGDQRRQLFHASDKASDFSLPS